MIKVKFRGIKKFHKTAIRIEENKKRKADSLVDEAATILVNDIRSHWSSSAPSSKGNAPAVVTGNLDSSVKKDRTPRDVLGRFAKGKNVSMQFVRIDTADGNNPQGRGNYAPVLENEMDRPFLEPAIKRISAIYPALAKRKLK